MTNKVGNIIRAMPEDVTLEPLSACRSIPGGGVKDMVLSAGWLVTQGPAGLTMTFLWSRRDERDERDPMACKMNC